MMIEVNREISEALTQWAKSKDVSVKQITANILGTACQWYLQGKISALREAAEGKTDE